MNVTLSAKPATFSRRPLDRLSYTITSCPSPTSRSERCDPMKPAPPVTSTLIVQHCSKTGLRSRLRKLVSFLHRPGVCKRLFEGLEGVLGARAEEGARVVEQTNESGHDAVVFGGI